MPVKVYMDGAIVAPEQATISIFDRGFLYGDSIYEVMRTSGGRLVDLAGHLERLERSAEFLSLPLPPVPDITRAVLDTLDAAANPESYVRIIVTRGGGEIGLDIALADRPTLIVIVKPLALLPDEAYERGVALRIVQVQRVAKQAVDPSVKSGNYLNNIMALREARAIGAHEALMCDRMGRVAEGSSSNVFVVRAGEIITPAQEVGLLRGITRGRVIDLARTDGIPVREADLYPEDVRTADEVFITSSIRSVLPVRQVDDIMLAPAPGAITRRVMALYTDHLRSVAQTA